MARRRLTPCHRLPLRPHAAACHRGCTPPPDSVPPPPFRAPCCRLHPWQRAADCGRAALPHHTAADRRHNALERDKEREEVREVHLGRDGERKNRGREKRSRQAGPQRREGEKKNREEEKRWGTGSAPPRKTKWGTCPT
ncbi:hypothetical protein BRADI_3g31763v3 [Brachypodium distachyon]|uniref:Uncharacterized protein n=1 Tax=Brachypodium distachyon TaxID=15368 RepID=A0A2K2D0F2_BRADI|nr:hypothetical protein BRADI_3g31763v3 [Brachypodium distachyon]